MDAYESTIIRLDEEFKNGLQNIRGYLMNLSSPHDARCCGEWLQKLRDSSDERELRNILLQRLTTQVQQRKLEYPFDRLPDNSPLYSLYEEGDANSWCTEDYETKSSKGTGAALTSEETDISTYRRNSRGDNCYQKNETVWLDLPQSRKIQKPNSINYPVQHMSQSSKKPSCLKSQQKNEVVKKEFKRELEEPCNLNKIRQNPGKIKSDELTNYVEEYKLLLSNYKKVVDDNLTDLAERLETAIENNQLQKSDLKCLQTSLQDSWSTKLQSLENELIAEVNKLEDQIATDRTKYENKIDELKQIILEKDEKINSLDLQIKQQGVSLKERMDQVRNELSCASKEVDINYKKKYNVMKKQLSQLEKMNRDLIKQHQNDIHSAMKDYELKIKSIKVSATNESVMEMECKLNQLERSYQKILQDFKRNIDDKSKSHHKNFT